MSKRSMKSSKSFGGLVILGLLLTSTAGAQSIPTRSALEKRQSCGAEATSSVFLPSEQKVESILLYGLPRGLGAPGTQVTVEVLAAGKPYLTESFTVTAAARSNERGGQPEPVRNFAPDAEVVVFELFDREADLRGQLLALKGNSQVEVVISANGTEVLRSPVDDFLADSEAVKKLGVLPEAIDSPASQVAGAEIFTIQPKFWVCGDFSCDTTGPHPESCATCPEDCGPCPAICGDGSCNGSETCSSCPADCGAIPLPNKVYTVLLSTSFLGFDCMKDIYWPHQGNMYAYTQFNYKRTTVSRVQQCDGSITETVLSVSYFSNYCHQYQYWPCTWPLPYTPPCYYI
jgi:hypothetical protein